MKIVDVELVQLVKQYEHPHRNSKQAATSRTISLVRLTTDEGIDGLGEAFCDPALAKSAVLSRLRPELLGEDPFNVEAIWNRAFHGAAMYNATGASRRRNKRRRSGLLGHHGKSARPAGLQVDRWPLSK